MKHSWMVFILLFFSALAIGAAEIHDEKIAFPGTFFHTISLANHYPDQVDPIQICLYLYSNLKKNMCQSITKDHPSFLLKPDFTWAQIQRVVLIGKNKDASGEQLSCVAYAGHHADTLISLEKVGDSIIEINYVGDHYMVCSLIDNMS